MEKIKNKSIRVTVAIAILAMLLVTSSFVVLGGSKLVKPSTYATPLSPATNYGDIMQYDWPQAGGDEGRASSNTGPAPDRANVLWKVQTSGSGAVSIFNGMAFVASGSTIMAYDAFTGRSIWNSTAPGAPSPTAGSGINKIDETYFMTQGSGGITVRKIATGELVWNATTPNGNRQPGSGAYFGGLYSTSMKMSFNTAYDIAKHQAQIIAVDLSIPTLVNRIAWIYVCDQASEILAAGDGMVFLGTTEGEVTALNAAGQKVWQSPTLGGIAQQAAMYYNHKLYTSAVSWQLTCFDGFTGELLWQAEKGIRAFTAYHGACGAGMIFDATDDIDPYGTIGAWDAETGVRIWKQPAYFNIHYDTMAYGGGKVYGIKCDRAAGSATAGLKMPGQSTTCWDAYTGTEIFDMPGISFVYPTIGYGNLYGTSSIPGQSGTWLICIGGEPTDWNYGLLGNVEQPRVAVGQQGPKDISTPKWMFQADGDIYSSPAIVDGKVYVGSGDKHLYCLNAFTGKEIWNFTIGHYLRSSPTVVGGVVYLGADDGYFYAIDAITGTQKWKTSAGGFFPNILDTNEADARCEPIIVGDTMIAGALDNNVYCLDKNTGSKIWNYSTAGPILGSGAYSAGKYYVASCDGYLYALTASNGAFLWKSPFTLNRDVGIPAYCEFYNIATPTVANGTVFIGGGVQYGTALLTNATYYGRGQSTPSGANGGGILMFAFNATTGASIWAQSRAGNTQPAYVPCYFNGVIYAPEFFEVTSMNALRPNNTGLINPVPDFVYTDRRSGNRTWAAWVGYQIQGSVTLADDLTGSKIYVGSDIGSIYCMNATMGNHTFSVYTAGGNVPCSPSVWDGKMYIGTTQGILYCFDDSPVVDMKLWAAASKGTGMWNNETITIAGQLTSNPLMMEFDGSQYVPVASQYSPGVPNATIQISLTKPDGSNVQLQAITGKGGAYSLSYTPTEVGAWGWVAYYEGKRSSGMSYSAAYSQFNNLRVDAAPVAPTPTPTPTAAPTATPTIVPTATPSPTPAPVDNTMTYAAVAIVVVIVVIAAAFFFLRKKKA